MSSRKTGAEGTRPGASTGPRSAEGKAHSSMNALKSGVYCKSLTIPGEDPAHLAALTEEYFQRFCPTRPEERDLVDVLVRSTWTLRRLATAESQVWAYQMDTVFKCSSETALGKAFTFCDKTLTRLQRIVNSTQRNFRDALCDLERLQALVLSPNLDTQPQPSPAPTNEPPPDGPSPSPQQTDTKPVRPSGQFVPSSSVPSRSAPRKPPQEPLPFHRPGTTCDFEHLDPSPYQRCPRCFPGEESRNGQE